MLQYVEKYEEIFEPFLQCEEWCPTDPEGEEPLIEPCWAESLGGTESIEGEPGSSVEQQLDISRLLQIPEKVRTVQATSRAD